MNWKLAKKSELYVIMFADDNAPESDKLAAKEEVERRKKQVHARMQNREKAHYPR
jgi:hypothetical protein